VRISVPVRDQGAPMPAGFVRRHLATTALPATLPAKVYLNREKLAAQLPLTISRCDQQPGGGSSAGGGGCSQGGAAASSGASGASGASGGGAACAVAGLVCVPPGVEGVCVTSYRLTSKGLLEVMLEAADEALAAQVRGWWAARQRV
jgi:hypothetical protein